MFSRLAHLLLPRESNNFRAKILHHSSLSSIIGFFLIVQLFLTAILIAKPSVLGFASQISPEKIVELTNQEREKAGVPPLKLNSLLSEAAQMKAGDMFAFNYWAHNSPSGRDPWSFFKEVGYKYSFAGENLARDFSSPEAVVAAWMASPTHRGNLLNSKFSEIGVSVVDGTIGGAQTTLVVQHLGVTQNYLAQVPRKAVVQQVEAKIPPSMPTVVPTTFAPAPVSAVAAGTKPKETVMMSQTKGNEKVLISPFTVTKQASSVILFVLIAVVILDGIAAYRKKVFRLNGRSFAHFLFLGVMILLVILSTQGVIL
ncbi:MAG: CAP domain-containing protein [bacterium]|nr:CAP domain-containing protein [bacterium]